MHQFNRGDEVSRRPERPDAHARAGGPGYLLGPEYFHLNARRYHESIAAPAPAPASVAEDRPESKEEQHAVVTLRIEFREVQAKHAVAPIAFRETQRDFKRYAAVIAAKPAGPLPSDSAGLQTSGEVSVRRFSVGNSF